MANTFLTPDIIAKEALMVLENNLVMAGLVNRDYSPEFAKVGDTLQSASRQNSLQRISLGRSAART